MSIDLRQQIINTATVLFMKNGYVSTSTRQIANILQVTQPAIYHHFKNKEQIYTEVLIQFATEVGNELKDIMSQSISKRQILVDMALYLQQKHPMNFSMMMHDIEYMLSEEAEKKIFNIWRTYYFSPFIDFFSSIDVEIVTSLNTQLVAQHFLRILSAYISEHYENELEHIAEVEDMVDIFLRGITIGDIKDL